MAAERGVAPLAVRLVAAENERLVDGGALDAVRSQTVGMDGAIDRGVWRLVRRNAPRPAAPPLLRSPAET